MNNTDMFRSRFRVLLGGIGMLVSVYTYAQAPPAPSSNLSARVPGSDTIRLASDQCPVVHGGDRISLEWYPGFDDERLVDNLRTFKLTFSPVGPDGVNVNDRQRITLGGASRSDSAPTANGYFLIKVVVPRSMPPGAYHLVDADSTPLLPAQYRYLKLKMTNSPVNSRFCITVEPLPSTEGKAASK